MGLHALRSAGMTTLRRVRDSFGGTAIVLAYHRVADDPLDPLQLAVPTERFEAQVSRLAEGHTFMTAGDLFAHLAGRERIPEGAVVITLDDGYADALTGALPVLERHGAPATVFVTPTPDGAPFWWDEATRLLLSPGVLAACISLAAGAARLDLDATDARKLDEAGTDSLCGWNVTLPPTHPRQRLFLKVLAFLRPLSGAERAVALGQLASQVEGASADAPRPLKPEQIVELDRSDLVEIGAHTLSHEILALRSVDEQRREIEGSKRAIETLLGHEVTSFAYPHGGAGDYSAETVRIVREAGFLGACTTRLGGAIPWGSVGLRTNRFEVPRTATVGLKEDALVALVDKRLGR